MGVNLERINIIQETLLSKSNDKINEHFEFYIINTIDIRNKTYIRLSIAIDGNKCDQFVIKKNIFSNFIKYIKVNLKDIKLKMIYNKNYLEIKDYQIITKFEINIDALKTYTFDLPRLVDNINLIENNKNISIKLKVEETDNISSYSYKFYNNYSENINVDIPNEFLNFIENDKIYLFNGFNYSSINNSIKPINISSIEIVDINSDIENINFKDIEKVENNEIVNIKGKIIDVSLKNCYIIIEEINTKINVEIKLNINLFKKINQNNICTFLNFQKSNNKYIYTNLSDIYSNEKTIVNLYFKDLNELYYNKIKVNNKSYSLVTKKNNVEIVIDSADKEEIFEQKFIYEKVKGNLIESNYEFILEINKNKINNFCSFLKKNGGYTYQLYFQSKNPENLPKDINIKINEETSIKMNIFDNYENNLRKRMTIINAIEQNFFDKELLSGYKENEINKNNLKIYYLIKNNINNDKSIINTIESNNILNKRENITNDEQNSKFIFEYKEIQIKKRFLLEEKTKEEIDFLFEKICKEGRIYDINNYSELKDKLNSLFLDKTLEEYCKLGFKKYIFKNSKEDYEIVKKIVILYMFYENYYSCTSLVNYLNPIKLILANIKNGTYLEKIQVLLYLFDNIYKGRDIFNNEIINIFGKNDNFSIYIEPCIEAFKVFFEIIDKQKVECPFYQTLLQFNGLIKTDLISKKKIYSGAIYSMMDI